MEVKPGYKQTEVGVIPEDWGTSVLFEVADCLDNVRIPLNDAQRQKRQGDIPYCGANGVLDFVDGFVIDDDTFTALFCGLNGKLSQPRATPWAEIGWAFRKTNHGATFCVDV